MKTLTDDDIKALLNKRDRWIALTTIGKDGFPHTVPIGYFFFENRLVIGCRDHTQKVKNIERNPKVSLLWENGRGKESLTGVMYQGRARIVRDDSERLVMKNEARRQRGEEPVQEVVGGAVYIEVSPEKIISWDRPTRRKK